MREREQEVLWPSTLTPKLTAVDSKWILQLTGGDSWEIICADQQGLFDFHLALSRLPTIPLPQQKTNRMSLATPPSRVYHLLPSDSSLMLFVLCLHRLCCAGNLSHLAPNFWDKVPDTPCKCQCILKGTNPSSPSPSFIVWVCSSNQLYLIIGPLQNFVDHHYNPCCFENGHCCDHVLLQCHGQKCPYAYACLVHYCQLLAWAVYCSILVVCVDENRFQFVALCFNRLLVTSSVTNFTVVALLTLCPWSYSQSPGQGCDEILSVRLL